MIFRSLGGGDANFNSAFYTKGNPSFDAASAIAVPLPGSVPAYNYQLLVVNSTFMILYGATTHTASTSDVKGNTIALTRKRLYSGKLIRPKGWIFFAILLPSKPSSSH